MDKVPQSTRKPPVATRSRKGVPNKATGAIKDMILTALSDAGGSDYLLKRANDPKTASAFLGLVGKVLPMQVTGADGNPLNVQFNVKFD
jgi:hypothetical protein